MFIDPRAGISSYVMSALWGKVKVNVVDNVANLSLGRSEKDRNEDDTVISRALNRYYGSQQPEWLEALAPAPAPTRHSSLAAMPGRSAESGVSAPGRLQRTPTTDFSSIYSRSRMGSVVQDSPAESPQPTGRRGSTQTNKLGSKLRAHW